MSTEKKESVVDVNIKFKVTETGEWPPFIGTAEIVAVGSDGQVWQSGVRYEGTEERDVVRTICRMDRFSKAVSSMAIAAFAYPILTVKDDDRTGFDIDSKTDTHITDFSDLAKAAAQGVAPPPVETEEAVMARRQARFDEQRENFYKSLHKDIQGWKYGQIRKFCTENGLETKVQNGANLVDIADDICKELKKREAIAKESNEKNNITE